LAKPSIRLVLWTLSIIAISIWGVGLHYNYGGNWIHVLLALGIGLVLVLFIRARLQVKNIDSQEGEIPKWDPSDPKGSLSRIFAYVLDQAVRSSNWYWQRKKSKAFFSQIIRFSAWLLAAVAGLLPILGKLLDSNKLSDGLIASLLVGAAAALFGLDKVFGFSSGWARYVLAGTNIRKSLEQFRLEWASLMAEAGPDPTNEKAHALLERAIQFRVDVENLVVQETKDWVTEFQTTMAQMEKDVAAQLTTLKAQVDKTIQAKETASLPGAIQLTIVNPAKAAAGSLKVTLQDSKNQSAQDAVTGASWAKINITPGQYHLMVEATVNGQPFVDQKAIIVEPGKTATPQVTL
jgi:hypothetical protein